MTRPEIPEDLPAHQLQGHFVAAIHSQFISAYPSLGMHLLAALAEADHLGLFRGGDEIRIPLTDAELADRVKGAQRSWDYAKKTYEEVMSGGACEKWQEYTITNWAKDEGLPLPVFAGQQVAS